MFKRLLGIDTGTAAILKNALQKAAVEEEVAEEIVTMFGIKYVTRFEISYSDYRSAVVAVWIVENNSTRPRLVTCYVE
ncbi:MAG: hypothetical protein HJJLKODD_01790 [Phycisphaerae bacterium]|nr:hypothetical protein [Phycisphaerae bacterium]